MSKPFLLYEAHGSTGVSTVLGLWTGGWMFGYSNVTFDLDVYAPYGSSGSNIKIGGKAIDPKDEGKYVAPHAPSVPYSVAGYW
jgi:sulfur-oxidizing protein SoxB